MHQNLAALVLRHADSSPQRTALVDVERREDTTFGALAERVGQFRAGLRQRGIGTGDRVVLMIAAGPRLFAMMCAVLAEGAAVVLVQPGMRLSDRVQAVRTVDASLLVVPRRIALAQWVLPDLWGADAVVAGAGFGPFDGIDGWRDRDPVREGPVEVAGSSAAMVWLRSRGSAVVQSHAMVRERLELSSVDEGSVAFSMFDESTFDHLAGGITTVLPPFDVRHPSELSPPRVVRAWRTREVTTVVASVVLLQRIVEYLRRRDRVVASVEQIVVAGGPVSRPLAVQIADRFPNARAHAIHGRSPGDPACRVALSGIVESPNHGYLVGDPVRGWEVRIVEPARAKEGLNCPVHPGEVGELLIAGPGVPGEEPRWCRTRELARRDRHGIWLVGPGGGVVRFRGRALRAYEVEHPVTEVIGVRQAAVVQHRGGTPVLFYSAARNLRAEVQAVLRDLDLSDLELRRIPTLPASPFGRGVDRTALLEMIADASSMASL